MREHIGHRKVVMSYDNSNWLVQSKSLTDPKDTVTLIWTISMTKADKVYCQACIENTIVNIHDLTWLENAMTELLADA